MIPMRDGVKLHAVILKPADIATPLPIPHAAHALRRGRHQPRDRSSASRPELARDGYIYVGEDIRGRYKSEGKFVMMRPLADHHDPKAIDESTDTYDTVAWLLKNVPGNNGRVGVVGTSYPGFLAMMAGIDPHPAVKAISPQAPMIDVWMGDDFFHNGAFRQSYGYDYVFGMESSKENTEVSYGKDKDGKPVDGFDYFLERGSFAEDVKQSGSKMLPTWKLFLDHPAYDTVWSLARRRASPQHRRRAHAHRRRLLRPGRHVRPAGGVRRRSSRTTANTRTSSSSAPGGTATGRPRRATSATSNYGEPIGKEFRAQIEAKFFAHYLKDAARLRPRRHGQLPDRLEHLEALLRTFRRMKPQPTSLLPAGRRPARAGATATAPAKTSYVSDPANPVPYRHRPIQPTYGEGSQWYNWLTEDQRFVTDRKDVAVWKLPVLKKDLIVTGEVVADIFAATTGTDNDMVVKLIDQYPDDDPDPKMRGYQLMTNAEIFRGRYLASFDKPDAAARRLDPRVQVLSLHDVDHVFKAGHTVMVEIQSTWFPLYDRNPQTFVPNIMKAKPEDYKPATITIYSDPSTIRTCRFR